MYVFFISPKLQRVTTVNICTFSNSILYLETSWQSVCNNNSQSLYNKESCDTLSQDLYSTYSRVWNKRTPLNKRSPLENLPKRIIVAPFFTLYYEVRNKAVAPGKKSKN